MKSYKSHDVYAWVDAHSNIHNILNNVEWTANKNTIFTLRGQCFWHQDREECGKKLIARFSYCFNNNIDRFANILMWHCSTSSNALPCIYSLQKLRGYLWNTQLLFQVSIASYRLRRIWNFSVAISKNAKNPKIYTM